MSRTDKLGVVYNALSAKAEVIQRIQNAFINYADKPAREIAKMDLHTKPFKELFLPQAIKCKCKEISARIRRL